MKTLNISKDFILDGEDRINRARKVEKYQTIACWVAFFVALIANYFIVGEIRSGAIVFDQSFQTMVAEANPNESTTAWLFSTSPVMLTLFSLFTPFVYHLCFISGKTRAVVQEVEKERSDRFEPVVADVAAQISGIEIQGWDLSNIEQIYQTPYTLIWQRACTRANNRRAHFVGESSKTDQVSE